jgi:chaperonin cofactor prefoldin
MSFQMQKKPSSFDLSQYYIEFNSVFYFQEIQDKFLEFLKTEFNTEPLLCVLAINELNKLNSDKEIIDKCNEIFNKFIKQGVQNEVNVSMQTKQKLIDSLEKQLELDEWVLDETAYELLTPLKNVLSSELAADNFPRFVRSKLCSEFIFKYSDDPRVMKLNTAVKYPFDDQHFEKPFITRGEMQFLEELLVDSFIWDSLHSKNVNLYTTQLNFIPDSKFFSNSVTLKILAVFPYSFERVVNLFLSTDFMKLDEQHMTDFSVKETFSIANLSKKFPDDVIATQVHSVIAETCVVNPFPMNTPRKSIDVFSIDFDNTNGCLYFVRRPYLKDFTGKNVDLNKKIKFDFIHDEKKEKKTVEGYIDTKWSFIKIEMVDSHTTKVSVIKSEI